MQNITEHVDLQPERAHESLLQPPGALQSRNVRIHRRRTSVRLEPEMWNALNEIAALETSTVHEICSAVHDLKDPKTSFTAALRVFLMEYYRNAAKTSPHVGQVQKLLKTQINGAALTG